MFSENYQYFEPLIGVFTDCFITTVNHIGGNHGIY